MLVILSDRAFGQTVPDGEMHFHVVPGETLATRHFFAGRELRIEGDLGSPMIVLSSDDRMRVVSDDGLLAKQTEIRIGRFEDGLLKCKLAIDAECDFVQRIRLLP